MSEQREKLAEVPDAWRDERDGRVYVNRRKHPDSSFAYDGEPSATRLFLLASDALAQMLAEARAEALREAADAQESMCDTYRDQTLPGLAARRAFAGWLRDEADALAAAEHDAGEVCVCDGVPGSHPQGGGDCYYVAEPDAGER